MKNIEVCLSPDLIGILDLKEKTVVVVDVLRATSCMAAGLANGVEHILPFDNVEDCQSMSSQGYITAGERNGRKIPGMDIGNSPFDYMDERMNGQKVATTTTNGTKSIHLSKNAQHIITGAFLNISSVARYVQSRSLPCIIVCAGWKGKVNLEDSLFAGNLIDLLTGTHMVSDDSSWLVYQAYKRVEKDPLVDHISWSEHAQRLAKFNIIKDIEFCSKRDVFDVVPEMNDGRLIKAVF